MASSLWLWKPTGGRGLMGEEGPGDGEIGRAVGVARSQ